APCGTSYVLVAASSLAFLAGLVAALALAIATLGGPALMRRRIVLEHLALEDPDLDPDDPVGRPGLGGAIVDIGTQRVQRHPTLAIPFRARDIGAAETAAHIHPDAA